jgi:hypothetical protein
MRNLLALVGAAVVTFVGAGYYLGWFSVHRPSGEDGSKSYNVELNTSKIGADLHKGKELITNKLKPSKEETAVLPEEGPPLEPPAPFNLTSRPGKEHEQEHHGKKARYVAPPDAVPVPSR